MKLMKLPIVMMNLTLQMKMMVKDLLKIMNLLTMKMKLNNLWLIMNLMVSWVMMKLKIVNNPPWKENNRLMKKLMPTPTTGCLLLLMMTVWNMERKNTHLKVLKTPIDKKRQKLLKNSRTLMRRSKQLKRKTMTTLAEAVW